MTARRSPGGDADQRGLRRSRQGGPIVVPPTRTGSGPGRSGGGSREASEAGWIPRARPPAPYAGSLLPCPAGCAAGICGFYGIGAYVLSPAPGRIRPVARRTVRSVEDDGLHPLASVRTHRGEDLVGRRDDAVPFKSHEEAERRDGVHGLAPVEAGVRELVLFEEDQERTFARIAAGHHREHGNFAYVLASPTNGYHQSGRARRGPWGRRPATAAWSRRRVPANGQRRRSGFCPSICSLRRMQRRCRAQAFRYAAATTTVVNSDAGAAHVA